MQFKHTRFDESVNVTDARPLRQFFLYISAILGIVLGLYVGSALLVDMLAPSISTNTERWMWEHIFRYQLEDLSQGRNETRNVTMERHLQTLLQKIPKDGLPDYDYEVFLNPNSSELNAMALPGGKIILYKGLVDALKSENALTFVLGHELGHFANRDHLRGMGREFLLLLLLSPLSLTDSGVGNLAGSFRFGLEMHFSREQEHAADAFGMQALQSVYGHAGGATEFFEVLLEKRDSLLLEGYWSSHPVSEERIAHIRQLIAQEKLPVGPTEPRFIPTR